MAQRRQRSLPLLLVAGLSVSLTGCSGPQTGTFTILDDGSGAQLCETVMESYPPQCNGESVVDWSWDAVPYDEASGVRWGEYTVTVTRDGDRVHVELVDPAASEAP